MLGAVGIMTDREDNVVEYALAAFALPEQNRTTDDWRHIHRVACALEGRDVAVPVHFLGLWDTVKVPGAPALSEGDWLDNVMAGRHAVAIDGGSGPYGECRIGRDDDSIEEVWFRGTHCDVVGGPKAYWPLADIALDWMLDGVVAAGALLGDDARPRTPAPSDRDALAEGAPSLRFRRVPDDALVHASVDVYLRSNPDYWRRLPSHVVYSDLDWAARAERMSTGDSAPSGKTQPGTDELAAVAS
jgi:uncharacterized protein (DUF2235 family)